MKQLITARGKTFFYNKLERQFHLFILLPIYVVLALLPFFLDGVEDNPRSYANYFLTITVYFPLLIYLNIFVLIPDLLRKGLWLKYVAYLLGLVVLLAFFDSVSAGIVQSIFEPQTEVDSFLEVLWYKIRAGLAGLTAISVLSFAYRFTVDWIINLSLIERLKAEKYAMELAFLKSQVDPHFLFNTLNSLYSLALSEKGNKTADGIAKLGTLMRYNLHDSQAERIPVQKELDYIIQYIDLQRLRLHEGVEIDLQIKIPEESAEVIDIAPMLLMPFVENAFKYGVSTTDKAKITIKMSLVENRFELEVVNLLLKKDTGETSGIGLKNVQERLALLYPERHRLDVGESGETYRVKLEIEL